MLLALMSAGKVQALTEAQRASICHDTRQQLLNIGRVAPWSPATGYPFLSHEEHWEPICSFLRERLAGLWAEGVVPEHLAISAVVFDRFHRTRLSDIDGAQAATGFF